MPSSLRESNKANSKPLPFGGNKVAIDQNLFLFRHFSSRYKKPKCFNTKTMDRQHFREVEQGDWIRGIRKPKNKFLADWAWRNFWLDAKFFQCHAQSGKRTINRIEISDKSILILVNYYYERISKSWAQKNSNLASLFTWKVFLRRRVFAQ